MRHRLVFSTLLIAGLGFMLPVAAQQPVTRRERAAIVSALTQRIADLEVERPKQVFTNSENSAQVNAIDAQLDLLRTRLADLHQIRRRGSATQPVTRQERLAIVTAIEQRIAALEVERPSLLVSFTADWPEIRSIDSQLAQLRIRLSELVSGARRKTTPIAGIAGRTGP